MLNGISKFTKTKNNYFNLGVLIVAGVAVTLGSALLLPPFGIFSTLPKGIGYLFLVTGELLVVIPTLGIVYLACKSVLSGLFPFCAKAFSACWKKFLAMIFEGKDQNTEGFNNSVGVETEMGMSSVDSSFRTNSYSSAMAPIFNQTSVNSREDMTHEEGYSYTTEEDRNLVQDEYNSIPFIHPLTACVESCCKFFGVTIATADTSSEVESSRLVETETGARDNGYF